jgi:enterochelin esterase-like enzyme
MARLTRRQILIGIGAGTGGVVAVGAGALVAIGGPHRDHLLHQVGLEESPNNKVAPTSVTILNGEFASKHMGRAVGWSLSIPSRQARGVIYCLHGRGGNHHFAFDEIHLPDVVESVKAPLVVAAVDGGPDSYWHPRTDGTDALSMLRDEFIPMVEERTNTNRRALLGWSMGGYGSLLAAEQSTGRFFAVTVASPALWTSPGQTAPGAFDGAADYHRFDVFAGQQRLSGLAVRVDCGTGDPFYRATRRFVSGLPSGYQGSFGRGFHDPAYWRSVAPAQVTTIAQALDR